MEPFQYPLRLVKGSHSVGEELKIRSYRGFDGSCLAIVISFRVALTEFRDCAASGDTVLREEGFSSPFRRLKGACRKGQSQLRLPKCSGGR